MRIFEGYALHSEPIFSLNDYLFGLPLNMRQLRRVGLLTEQTFPLKKLAEASEIIQQFKFGCNYITDQSPAEEIRFDFVELNRKSKKTSAIAYEQTDQALELLSESNTIIAGFLGHISSRYQLFLEKSLLSLPQTVLITNDMVALYKFNLELIDSPHHYFVLSPEGLVRLGNLLGIKMRPVRLPSSNWYNLCQLANKLQREVACVSKEQIIVCDPAFKQLVLLRLTNAADYYYQYMSLLASLITAYQSDVKPVSQHMQAAAMILQAAFGGPTPQTVVTFLKSK